MTAGKGNAADYWGYLIEADKSAAPKLEQLLLGIAKYITKDVAPWHLQCLTPDKLAAFYRLVNGNYDPLFIDTPHATLSFIYQSLGCFHTLQPTPDAFAPPTIPALTPQGFVRWQTIQLLLDPEEHVPYLQRALKRFDPLGEGFPKVLPREAFPASPDEDMTRWHERVCELLKSEAETEQEKSASGADDHHHAADVRDSSSEPRIDGRVPVDDIPDYFSHSHRQHREGRREVAHVSPGFRQPVQRPAGDHKSYHSRSPSHTEHSHRRDPYSFPHGAKSPDKGHHSTHHHHRSRNSDVSSESASSDEERSAPSRARHSSTSRHHSVSRHHDSDRHDNSTHHHHHTDRLFPPSIYRDRRHSHHTIHRTPTYSPPPASPQTQYPPSYLRPPSRDPVGARPRGHTQAPDLRWRDRDIETGHVSLPSTPGVYPGRGGVRLIEGVRDPGLGVGGAHMGVGGRRYPGDAPTAAGR
ncbi:hypothetical protein MMC16_001510 [Acarospora aff. strigata]|nr:hypothetical protein [Acarospora aff. strigata]